MAATPKIVEGVAEDLSGKKIHIVPRQNIDGNAHGVSYFLDVPGQPLVPDGIEIADDLPQPQREMVMAHEVAHYIDETAGQIPTNGLDDELRYIYSTTATGREKAHPPVGPEPDYTGDDIQRELMTEAIRTYTVNPNWIKSVAPRTAARIREWVNTHPQLSKIIQFNSLVAGSTGLALAGQSEDSDAREIPSEAHREQSSMFEGPYPIFGPPIPNGVMNGAKEAASNGRRQIRDALIRRSRPQREA